MNLIKKNGARSASASPLVVALLFTVVPIVSSCDFVEETGDDYDSYATCREYCAKRFDCENEKPSNDETNDCVDDCRNSMEDNCGNENQAAANEKLEECVDKGCVDFWLCLVFESAPECFGFADNQRT